MEIVPGELLVGMRAQATTQAIRPRLATVGRSIAYHSSLRIHRFRIAPGISTQQAMASLRQDPGVAFVEPNHVLHAFSTPNNTGYARQWALKAIHADLAWPLWQPQSPVILAIVDTGVDSNHPDLTNKILRDATGVLGYDATTGLRSVALDGFGHGTHCAGIAAAQINGGNTIAGVAGWNGLSGQSDTSFTKIMPVKVLSDTGSGTDASVADGIVWAADHNAKVISLSLGGPNYSVTLESSCQYAWSKGCLLVAAAGNSGSASPSYPGANSHVVSVAATDNTDTLASFSNFGPWVSVAAPGVGIYSTLPSEGSKLGSNYGVMSGTSMATPHVAGEAAFLWAQSPGLTNDQLAALIESNVDPITVVSGHTIAAGAGRINMVRALSALPALTLPPPALPAAPTGLTAQGFWRLVTLRWSLLAHADVAQVRIYRADTVSGAFSLLATAPPVMEYIDVRTSRNASYRYKVTAVDSHGAESIGSIIATVRVK